MSKICFFGIIFLLGVLSACENLKMEGLQNDPNNPSAESANLNDLYNNIQLQFNEVFYQAEYAPGALARMYIIIADTYQSMVTNYALNGLWNNAYNELLPDIDALLLLSEGNNFRFHTGSSKILKAYTLMILVDLFGDIPFSETGKGTNIISPKLDPGEDVYAGAIQLLNEAIEDLSNGNSPPPAFDNYYNGNADKWIKLANSLKFRAALVTRDVALLNTLIDQNNFINSNEDDFQFNYGKNRSNPDSRNPYYTNHYESGSGAYLNNYYMWMLRNKTSTSNGTTIYDPRLRYFFYRKVDDALSYDPTAYSCDRNMTPEHWLNPFVGNNSLPWCSELGYYGRHHLQGGGIPPDDAIKTSFGLYPFGGDFDDDSFTDNRKSGTTGGLGQGISPIMLASFVDFMWAEAIVRFAIPGNARDKLGSAIYKSLNKVESFESLVQTKMNTEFYIRSDQLVTVKTLYGMNEFNKANYINEVLISYDQASGFEKLDIVIQEFYIAAWGNGLEAYNMYRRTGYPSNMSSAVLQFPGNFPLSFYYPSIAVDRNANIKQKKDLSVPVFWQDPTLAAVLY